MTGAIIEKIMRRLRHYRALFFSRSQTRKNLAKCQGNSILVLCYGNIYRSPFVENYLKMLLHEKGEFDISSAGFYEKAGRESPGEHIKMSAEYGVDLSAHRSSIVDRKMIERSDYIVIMDRFNWEEMDSKFPFAAEKLIWLGTLNGYFSIEIEDPYGKPKDKAKTILTQLKNATETFVHYLGKQL